MSQPETELKQYTFNLSELPNVVQELLPIIIKRKVIALHGDLGAGKTTFTSELCRTLGTHEVADSPTFSLINQYSFADSKGTEQTIFHTDWYRIKDEEEARMAGIEDMMQHPFALCIIEWSENAPGLLPSDTLHLWFKLGETTESRILSLLI